MARVGFEPTNSNGTDLQTATSNQYRPLRLTRLRYRAKMLSLDVKYLSLSECEKWIGTTMLITRIELVPLVYKASALPAELN